MTRRKGAERITADGLSPRGVQPPASSLITAKEEGDKSVGPRPPAQVRRGEGESIKTSPAIHIAWRVGYKGADKDYKSLY